MEEIDLEYYFGEGYSLQYNRYLLLFCPSIELKCPMNRRTKGCCHNLIFKKTNNNIISGIKWIYSQLINQMRKLHIDMIQQSSLSR